MNQSSLKLTRKNLVISVVLLVLVLVLLSVLQNLNRGRLIVVASDMTAKITVADGVHKNLVGTGKADVRLDAGYYQVEASSGSSATRASVQIKRGQTTQLDLKLRSPTNSSVISDSIARDMYADQGGLIFLNTPYHQLFKTSTAGRPIRYLPDVYPLNRVDWLNDGSAVLNLGGNSVVYLDKTGGQHLFDSDITNRDSDYSVSKEGQVAFLVRGGVMLKSSPSSATQNIASIKAGSYNLSLSPDGKYLFIYSDLQVGDAPKQQDGYTNYLVNLTSKSSRNFKTDKIISSAAWDNDKLVYMTDSSINSYDIAANKSVDYRTNLDKDNAVLLAYFDDSVIYAKGQDLWLLSLAGGTSQKLTSFQGSITPSGFLLDSSKKVVYFSTDPDSDGNGGRIYQINLP